MSRVLLAGPWVGEFGWELFCWQAFIRNISNDFDKVIMIGRQTNEFLYKDYIDQYIPFDPKSFKTDAWRCHNAISHDHIIEYTPHDVYISGNFDIGMRYTHNGVVDTKGLFFNRQKFIKYVSDVKIDDKFSEDGYDVLFHCRNKSTGDERNWSYDKWVELESLLDEDILIGCIGNDEAFHIPNTDDLRNINTEQLVAIFNSSSLIVGPSSGPMHLASLSGLDHLVWSTDYNRVRYEKDWNPLKTKVIFHSEGGWDPNPNKIAEIINDLV